MTTTQASCDTDGHDFPRVVMQSPCQPEPEIIRGVCGRCGFDPTTDMPRLWEGDQA